MIKVIIHLPSGLVGRSFSQLTFAHYWIMRHSPTAIIPHSWEDR